MRLDSLINVITDYARRLGAIAGYGYRQQESEFFEAYGDEGVAVFVSPDPTLPAYPSYYGYRIAAEGSDGGQMLDRLRFLLRTDCDIRYDGNITYGGGVWAYAVSLRLKAKKYGIGGGGSAVNVIVQDSDLSDDDVALMVTENGVFVGFIKAENFDYSTFDTNRYALKPFIRFHRGKNGRTVLMHAQQMLNGRWADFNRYRIHCDTTAAGGFDWAITIRGSAKSGSVTWAANDTLDSIVAQMTGVATFLVFSHESGEEFIRVRAGGNSDSTFTLSNETGATLDDLSIYTRINGVQAPQTHRTWQAQNVDDIFPNLGFLAANTKQYSVSGYNLSYRCGGNESQYKTYYAANGASSYLAETAVSSRMNTEAFAALNGSGVAEQQALYDKYNGSWDAYMDASMVNLNDTHTDGVEYLSYDNGDTQTAMLATVTTMDYDGSYICPFMAADNCYAVTDVDVYGGHCHLSTQHEIGVFMRDAKLSAINAAMDKLTEAGITVDKLSASSYYWSVARYDSNNAWWYHGYYGTLTYLYLYSSYTARPLAYLNA